MATARVAELFNRGAKEAQILSQRRTGSAMRSNRMILDHFVKISIGRFLWPLDRLCPFASRTVVPGESSTLVTSHRVDRRPCAEDPPGHLGGLSGRGHQGCCLCGRYRLAYADGAPAHVQTI
jgi:hypothetical protein